MITLSITILIHVLITSTLLEMAIKRENDLGWVYGTQIEGNKCNVIFVLLYQERGLQGTITTLYYFLTLSRHSFICNM